LRASAIGVWGAIAVLVGALIAVLLSAVCEWRDGAVLRGLRDG